MLFELEIRSCILAAVRMELRWGVRSDMADKKLSDWLISSPFPFLTSTVTINPLDHDVRLLIYVKRHLDLALVFKLV